MSEWANIATITKARSNEGGLFVRSTEGLPFLLSEGLSVAFVPPVLKVPRTGVITSVEQKTDSTALICVSTITSRSEAEQLVGHYCLAKKCDLPADFNQTSSKRLAGFMVLNANASENEARVGAVLACEENPAHPLLVVRHNEKDVRIPLVDEFLIDINEENRTITLAIPDGLLDV